MLQCTQLRSSIDLNSQVSSSEIGHLEELMHLQLKLLDFFVTCPGDD
jgi:hypothetical protein